MFPNILGHITCVEVFKIETVDNDDDDDDDDD
jgi:hypothetical protein